MQTPCLYPCNDTLFSNGNAMNDTTKIDKTLFVINPPYIRNVVLKDIAKMADTEFEEFRKNFESFPSHLKAPSPFYS